MDEIKRLYQEMRSGPEVVGFAPEIMVSGHVVDLFTMPTRELMEKHDYKDRKNRKNCFLKIESWKAKFIRE